MTSCVAEGEHPPGCKCLEANLQAAQTRDLGSQVRSLRTAAQFAVTTLKSARDLHGVGVDAIAWDLVSQAEHELHQALR